MKMFLTKLYQFMDYLSTISQPVLLNFVLGAVIATPLVHWPVVAFSTVGGLALSKGGLDLWARHTDVPKSTDPSFKSMIAAVVGAGLPVLAAYITKI